LKILVVDDNPINRRFIRLSLRNDHDVELAGNGEEAVLKASDNVYDLIIMDLHMPVVDGAEATLRIRRHEQKTNRRTPILIYSTGNTEKDRSRCLECGADEYLVKPVSAAALREKVSRFFD
jgi:CheY-like chemotaxis protein